VPYSCNPVAGATNYTWSAPAGARIFDGSVLSTTNTLTTTATSVTVNFASTAGNVRVKGNNSCGAGTNTVLAVSITCREQAPVTIGNLDATVYPNPAGEEIQVEFNSTATSAYQVRVLDLSGKAILIREGTATEGTNIIDMNLSEMPGGLYFLEIMNGEGKYLTRIAKQ
jgi:hypothetical protein